MVTKKGGVWLIALILLAAVAMEGCGRKGPPVVPPDESTAMSGAARGGCVPGAFCAAGKIFTKTTQIS